MFAMVLPKKRTSVVDSLSVESLSNEVVSAIRQGRLVPGQRLIEADFTKEFAVSRARVRETLARLAVLGIVDIQPNRGASVRRLTAEEVDSLMQLREPLEGLAARLAAQSVDKNSRANLSRIIARTHAAGDHLERLAYGDLNAAFHGAVAAMSNHEQLQAFLEPLHVQSFYLQWQVWTSTPKNERQSNVEHEQIARAILDHKPELAERLMREHVKKSASRTNPVPSTDSSTRRSRR